MTKRKRAVAPEGSTRDDKQVYKLPPREWDRATELVRLFVATGWLHGVRRQSVMLTADPGSGKTELLERFRINPYLRYASDLTARGVHSILRDAHKGAITHIVATEFQKFMMRKSSTADNMLGVLSQALEEGVRETYIGEKMEDFGGAQVGLIGAITKETMAKFRPKLQEVGFTSRVSIFPWSMSYAEMEQVMESIGTNNRADLLYVDMARPSKLIQVDMDPKYSKALSQYIAKSFRHHAPIRVFNRFRALAMASAVLEKRTKVNGYDLSRIFAFHPYWEVMEK